MGHMFTIPLCPLHHRGQRNDAGCTSRHPYRTAFEKRYGTEAELHEKTRQLVERMHNPDIDRRPAWERDQSGRYDMSSRGGILEPGT